MIGISSRISGAFSNANVLKLFQSASVSQTNENGSFQASASVAGTFAGPAARAIESIMQIVMNASGDSSVSINTKAAVTHASTGAGNDTISIQAARAYAVTSGDGNDTISIQASGRNTAGRHPRGDRSLPTVMGVGAGDGNDTINISARGTVMAVSGEAGNDNVNVTTDGLAFGIYGGTGNDTVNVDAKFATLVDGGAGNDVINVKADSIFGVSGGTGNDVINITNTGNQAAQVFFSQGDGQDVINSNGAVSINLFSADGTKKLDMSNATWSQSGNTVSIAFGNTGDAITVNLTGDAATGQANVTYDPKSGNLIVGPGSSESGTESSGISVSASVVTSA